MLKTAVALVLASALFAGCASSSTMPFSRAPLPDAASGTPLHKRGKGKLIVRIRIPRPKHGHRHGRYISDSTKGITLAFTGAATLSQSYGLTPSSPGCTGTPLVCTIAVPLKAGTYQVTLTAFDRAPVSGMIPPSANALATASNQSLTVAAAASNSQAFTMDGIPASIAVSGLPSATAGTPLASPQPFTVSVNDAGGETIIGPYANPVSLSDTDASGATTLSSSGSVAGELTNSSDVASITYTGLAIAPATISASADGVTTGTATFSPALSAIGPASLVNGVGVNPPNQSQLSFTASEVGWTNAPYNQNLTATPTGCDSFLTVSASGNTFTAKLTGTNVSGSCTLTLSDGAGQQLNIPMGAMSFSGSASSFTVPDGISQLTIVAAGGAGGAGGAAYGSPGGGAGALLVALFPVTPADTYEAVPGGGGGDTLTAGANGGGAGGSGTGSNPYSYSGGGGGGASDVRQNTSGCASTLTCPLSNRLIVAGGGGGGAGSGYGGSGGNAGIAGNAGGSGTQGSGGEAFEGGSPGLGLSYCGCLDGNFGSLGTGGAGGGNSSQSGGGGGGGGYYGGGGGAEGCSSCSAAEGNGGGGGGGGSSYATNAATVFYNNISTATQGYIIIAW